MLTRTRIIESVKNGEIEIKPFVENHVGPNSIDVRLAPTLLTITDTFLSVRAPYAFKEVTIEEEGTILFPGQLYLGVTVEWTHTPYHIPAYEGRSTLARYFVYSHATAGFGDLGFRGHWTLEITVERPIIVYPNIRIGQISFTEPSADEIAIDRDRYEGSYGDSDDYSRDPKPQPACDNNV